jgi:hypothetical protein
MQRPWIDSLIIQWFLGLGIRKCSRHIPSMLSGLGSLDLYSRVMRILAAVYPRTTSNSWINPAIKLCLHKRGEELRCPEAERLSP